MLDHIGHAPGFFHKGAGRSAGLAAIFIEPEVARQTTQDFAQVVFLPVRKLDGLLGHHLAREVTQGDAGRDQILGLGTTMHDVDLSVMLLGKFGRMSQHGRNHAISAHRD